MGEILLCNQSLSAQSLQNQCGIGINELSTHRCTKPTMAAANTPYYIGETPSQMDQNILTRLSPASVAKPLTDLALSYGGDNVVALAEISAQLRDYNIGMMGASTSVYANRMGGFADSVKAYQAALMEYRQAMTSNAPTKTALKQKAHAAFQKMQSQFRNELNMVTAQVKSRRGTPLTNPNRATNIARSSRSAAKLNVMNQMQANNLVKFSQYTKVMGNGLALIDFGSRVGNIQQSYQEGGNWERDLFIESSSFVASAGAGVLAVNAGTAALSLLVVATPVGWVGLIVGGLVVAGAAAGASMTMNKIVSDKSGGFYDDIMQWMSTL